MAMRKAERQAEKDPSIGEAGLLTRIGEVVCRAGIHKNRIGLGMGDDAALMSGRRGYDEILTCDWFLEGTHFLRDRHPPDAIGWKCLARAVSDVAAMGGVPRCFLLSLALPTTHTGPWLEQFLQGLRRASRQFGCELVGGDTTRRSEILINVTVVGEVRSGRAILRSRARPRDVLFVSGRLGQAELGLEFLRRSKGRVDSRDAVLKKHLYPEPRLALGRWLSEERLASAMLDLSDGLSTDLPRLCEASSVGARVEASRILAVRLLTGKQISGRGPRELALHGGDDYELLFTVPRRKLKQVPRFFHGVPLTRIGEITQELSLLLIDEQGHSSPLPNRGWDPFRNP